jgi:two-component system, cell cycle response regulator
MRVLVADDEIVSRRLLESSLTRWGYEVLVAADGLEALRIFQAENAPKLAVLDWMMPGLDGVELCRAIRSRKDDSYTYVLLLTAKQTKDEVIEGLEAGADDYITKPFEPQELRVRLRTGKRILYLLDQITTAQESMRQLASHDPLTKLWNRSAIVEQLDTEINRCNREQSSVGVVLIDLDHFKLINDTYGHLAGDRVLREASETMNGMIRPYDAVGRYGGEEFLMVLPGCDQINAVSHAERIRQALASIVVGTQSGDIHFSASFGVTVVDADTPADVQMAINAADSALYAAKRAGRNRVEFAPASTAFVSM